MNSFDKILETQIQNDKLDTKPSKAVFEHLRNQMLANSATSRMKQNSFIPIFRLNGNQRKMTWKISVAAVLFISFMGIKQINNQNIYIQSADSTMLIQKMDTLNFQLADSSFTY